MKLLPSLAIISSCLLGLGAATAADPIKVLLIDGQNNHKWAETSPVLEAILENTGRFEVEVATSPPKGEDLSGFNPSLEGFDVVMSNYNGELWGEDFRKAFEAYVAGGGGFVSVHAANNAFPQWIEYNQMIGVGGWGGRNEKNGPYVRWREGQLVKVTDAGRGGGHGPRHQFLVETRDPDHPVMKGLPSKWLHAEDELYDRLRGPAENLRLLATAFSAKDKKGTGENEPMLMALSYDDGRVFHTTLGHDTKAMSGVGFQETLVRGTEWAATGKVTFPAVGADQMPEDSVVVRDALKK